MRVPTWNTAKLDQLLLTITNNILLKKFLIHLITMAKLAVKQIDVMAAKEMGPSNQTQTLISYKILASSIDWKTSGGEELQKKTMMNKIKQLQQPTSFEASLSRIIKGSAFHLWMEVIIKCKLCTETIMNLKHLALKIHHQ